MTDAATAPPGHAAATHPRRRLHPLYWLVPLTLLLRLVMFIGRGDYVAFDEGWYLVLGRNLLGGHGFTLSGLQHTTLSPLFPMFAGTADLLIGNAVLSGRIVAALAAALILIPCWSIFQRLGGRRTALLGSIFVMAMPALAPFVVPYWVGWDLWVGAEPLLHVFLYTALALALAADTDHSLRHWLAAGVAFGLAFLARPEAILALGMIGLLTGAWAVHRRSMRTLLCAAVLGIGFLACAAPYWLYLHDVTGRWSLTGRGVEIGMPARAGAADTPASEHAGATETIERMLWRGDDALYIRRLYSLDSRTGRLASTYWGVPRRGAHDAAPVDAPGAATRAPGPDTAQPLTAPAPVPKATATNGAVTPPGRMSIFAQAIARVLPLYLWPLIVIGVTPSRQQRRRDLGLAVSIAFMSVAIAALVAADPRTQLFIAPLAAFYCARGARRAGLWMQQRAPGGALRRRTAGIMIAAGVLALLFGTQARWLYMSMSVGSPHHIVGTANAEVGRALQSVVPEDQPVMSWHPAIALYARRDWRVLPAAEFADIVRYSAAIGSRYIVLSPYYPGPRLLGEESADYLVIDAPPATASAGQWTLEISRRDGSLMSGTLRP